MAQSKAYARLQGDEHLDYLRIAHEPPLGHPTASCSYSEAVDDASLHINLMW